ncbi:MAG TPA: hypothetical protein VNZ22_14145 [Bacillota bacterium]|nr:hypothetical protein [Bacillota bacterium]
MNVPLPTCDRWRSVIRLQVCDALAPEAAETLAAHLANCAPCRRYAREIQGAATSLRALAARPLEPSPHFRSRWTAAVHQSARPASLHQMLLALLQWGYGVLRHNRRPLLALAPVWLLILTFKLTVPEPAPASPTQTRSPTEIFRALQTQEQMLASQSDLPNTVRMLPPKSTSNPPRSDRTPRSPGPHRAVTPKAGLHQYAAGTASRPHGIQLSATVCL